jgi:N-acetyl-anhydromuramyl-L-alanine amidase AmpD
MKIVDGWVDIAIQMRNLDNTFGPLIAKPWFIVVHGTADTGKPTAVQVAQDMQRKDIAIENRKSVHFIIDKDGSLVQQLPITLSAWGNGGPPPDQPPSDPWLPPGNPNNYTISIEHVKWTADNSEELTSQQKKTSFALIDELCKVTGIPRHTSKTDSEQVIRHGGIIGHFNISPGDRKNCPGTFPWVELRNFLTKEEDEMVHLDLELNKARVLAAPTTVGRLSLSADFGTATVRVALKHRGLHWEIKDAVQVASTDDQVVIDIPSDVTKISAQVTAISGPEVVVSLDSMPAG